MKINKLILSRVEDNVVVGTVDMSDASDQEIKNVLMYQLEDLGDKKTQAMGRYTKEIEALKINRELKENKVLFSMSSLNLGVTLSNIVFEEE